MGIANLSQNGTLGFTCAAAVMLIGAVVTARWQQRSRKKSMPKKWRRVGEISELYIYPLKSGQYIKLEKGECTDLGLKTPDDHPLKLLDRFLMVYSENSGQLRTGRQHPHMVLLKLIYADGNHVKFEAPGMPVLSVKLPQRLGDGSEKKICTLFDNEQVEVLDCGDEAAEWMSTYLMKQKSGARLAYHLENVLERRDYSKPPNSMWRKYYENLEPQDTGVYTDFSTFMLMTEESVKELDDRMAGHPHKITPLQFRPNFVVRGSKAFAEDDWDWLRIGDDVILRNVRPCTRCAMVIIDPETGVRNKNNEPLKTLKTYRQVSGPAKKLEKEAPALGLYFGLRRPGSVRVGDSVYVGE